jgi:hypothetical protein
VQVTRATFIPLLTSAHSDRLDPSAVREEAFGELTVVYTFGPDFGRRVVTHADLDQLQLPPQILRRSALEHLEVLSSRAEFHGQPPALMLSFEGLESSLLLATDFWRRLEGAVPGELVVGVPARDVVIVTGSQSQPGMEKAKRCVERVFFAGGENLVSRNLLVRRNGAWEPYGNTARPSGRPTFGAAHQHGVGQPPREFQEHQSWPGERVPLQPTRPAAGRMGPNGPVRRRPQFPMHPVAPAAQLAANLDSTGSHRFDTTGSHRFDMTGSQRPISPIGPPPVPQPRPEPAYRPDPGYRDWAAEVAEAAQYSAVPYSSVPYSAVPYPTSSSPHSPTPQSVMPQSAVPYSALPYSQPPVRSRGIRGESGSWYPYQEQSSESARPTYSEPKYSEPSYKDESYSTGTLPRSLYSDYAPPAPEPAAPTYPASWGSAPDNGPSRPEFRTGPRSRFQ